MQGSPESIVRDSGIILCKVEWLEMQKNSFVAAWATFAEDFGTKAAS
jgi:hypothetical protein